MLLQLKNIKHSHEAERILNIKELNIGEGNHSLVIGKSGSGKTTLINVISGILKPQNGEIVIDGQNIFLLFDSERDKFRAKKMSIVFQNQFLIPSLSINDNLKIIRKLSSNTLNMDETSTMLELLKINPILKKLPHELNEKQTKKIAILKSLVSKPRLILVDELTSSLDAENTESICDLFIKSANKIGSTIIMMSHDTRNQDKFSHTINL